MINTWAELVESGVANLQTECAVAGYLAAEAGNPAAADHFQSLGGHGYAKERMAGKVRRDARIVTIHESTVEMMKCRIASDRWQTHLKTRGAYYLGWADRLDARLAETGADLAALAMRSLAALLECSRRDRLMRSRDVRSGLGGLIVSAEAAAIFAERADGHPVNAIPVTARTLKAMGRITGRGAALKVAEDGLHWITAAGATSGIAAALPLPAIYAGQTGLIEDMDFVAAQLQQTFPAWK